MNRTTFVGAAVLLASVVLGVLSPRFDTRANGEWAVLDLLHDHRTGWASSLAHGVELYGGPAFTPWLVLFIALVLFLIKRRFAAITFALVTGLSWLPGHFVKKLVTRERPDGLDAMTSYADGMSMPSGHTGLIAAATLAGCIVLLNERRRIRWMIVAGVALTLFVAVFRMYSAAHWPLDTLVGAGLATGTGLMLMQPSLAINRAANRRGGFWALPPAVNPERPQLG